MPRMAEQPTEPPMTEAERTALLRELALCYARAAVDAMLREQDQPRTADTPRRPAQG